MCSMACTYVGSKLALVILYCGIPSGEKVELSVFESDVQKLEPTNTYPRNLTEDEIKLSVVNSGIWKVN